MSIDPSAKIDSSVKLGKDVTIGPYSIIGPGVEIGDNSWIGPHVVISGPTRIGKENRIFQFSSIGEIPQDKKYHGESSRLEIGDRNTIREFVTINRGTDDGGGLTKIGNDNWLMAYIHIAHDCIVGNNTVFSNGASLAGHVKIDDYVTLAGFTLVHQFCSIGKYAFCGMGSAINKDILPYVMISGNPAKPYGINSEGLKRRGFSSETIRNIKEAYRIVFRSGMTVQEAIKNLELIADENITPVVEFLKASERGILR